MSRWRTSTSTSSRTVLSSPDTSSSVVEATSAATWIRTLSSQGTGSLRAPLQARPAYRDLFDDVLEYARSTVLDEDGRTVRQRVRWWSALALLRSLAYPQRRQPPREPGPPTPRPPPRTKRTHWAAPAVPDLADDEAIGKAWTQPLAPLRPTMRRRPLNGASSSRSRVPRRLCKVPKNDVKLKELFKSVEGLLRDGYHPIVFWPLHPDGRIRRRTPHRTPGWKRARCAVVTGTLLPRRAGRQDRRAHRGTRLRCACRHRLFLGGCQPPGELRRRGALRPRVEPGLVTNSAKVVSTGSVRATWCAR